MSSELKHKDKKKSKDDDKKKSKDDDKKKKKKDKKEVDDSEPTDREESDDDEDAGPTPLDLIDFVKTHVKEPLVDLLYNGQFKDFQDTDEFKNDTSREFDIDAIQKIEPKEKMKERLKYCLVYHYIYNRVSPGYFKFEKFCCDAKQDDLLWFIGVFDSLYKYDNDYSSFMNLLRGAWDAITTSKKLGKEESKAIKAMKESQELIDLIQKGWPTDGAIVPLDGDDDDGDAGGDKDKKKSKGKGKGEDKGKKDKDKDKDKGKKRKPSALQS